MNSLAFASSHGLREILKRFRTDLWHVGATVPIAASKHLTAPPASAASSPHYAWQGSVGAAGDEDHSRLQTVLLLSVSLLLLQLLLAL